jgi:hypothetical protein
MWLIKWIGSSRQIFGVCLQDYLNMSFPPLPNFHIPSDVSTTAPSEGIQMNQSVVADTR